MPTEFSAGRVLGRSLSLLFSNAGAFLLMVVLIHLPLVLFQLYLTTATVGASVKASGPLIIWVGDLFLQPLATASVTHGVLRQLRGKPATFNDCLRVGFSRMSAVLGVWIATFIIMMIGSFALCLPGLLAWLVLFVATPAAVAERLGVLDSLRRSGELTRGAWWPLSGVLAPLLVLNAGIATVIFTRFTDWHAEPPVLSTGRSFLVFSLVTSLVLQAVQSILSAAAYYELLRAREGGKDSDFLSVFD